jgi:hypothetical protein
VYSMAEPLHLNNFICQLFFEFSLYPLMYSLLIIQDTLRFPGHLIRHVIIV